MKYGGAHSAPQRPYLVLGEGNGKTGKEGKVKEEEGAESNSNSKNIYFIHNLYLKM